jgi:hypothetical protein
MLISSSANGAFVKMPHRRDPGASVRIPFVHGCLLTTRSRVRGGLVCNLSVLGVYVTLDEPLPEQGEVVHVSVHPPGQEPLLEADTVVTWRNHLSSQGQDSLPPGVGLRFVALAPSYEERIESLLRRLDAKDESGTPVLPNLPHAGPKRVPWMQPCGFTAGGSTIRTLICNVSRLGAYVTVRQLPEVGEQVLLAFVSPQDGLPLDLKAVVVWRNPVDPSKGDPLAPGCGIRFVALSPENEGRIRAIVDSTSAAGNG